jgi:uncharacterized membrane protein YbhN (UPF0104 family)
MGWVRRLGERVRERRAALAGGLLAAALLAVAFTTVDLEGVLEAVAGADLVTVALAISVSVFFNTVQSAELLRRGLVAVGERPRFRDVLDATTGNLALQAVIPLGAGNAGRVVWLTRLAGVDAARGTVAIVLVLALKLVAVLGLAVVGALLGPASALVRPWLPAALLALSMVGLAILPALARATVARLPEKLARLSGGLAVALTEARPRRLAWVLVHALLAMASEIAVFGLMLLAVGARVDPLLVLAAFPLVTVGAKVPLTTMGVGTRDALVLLLLAGAAPPETLLAATFLFTVSEYLLPLVVGTALAGPFMARMVRGR